MIAVVHYPFGNPLELPNWAKRFIGTSGIPLNLIAPIKDGVAALASPPLRPMEEVTDVYVIIPFPEFASSKIAALGVLFARWAEPSCPIFEDEKLTKWLMGSVSMMNAGASLLDEHRSCSYCIEEAHGAILHLSSRNLA